ncbi:hypothetical protein [Legionella sp. PC997]|uniref:hypothetical protein n=1 Tax=Legionella sp. PC997 TaxID=2755562 RepID=UPI0015F8458D|nr:hypothetical protein [Legionella sp. PC997]QMT59704.1 hypothetical protein HBNCFIEN_01071 [Legionella sp. PC997]
MKNSNNLYSNAISSIQMGVEDFSKDDSKRMLSAVRNIYSGLVLLYKAKLWELSPVKDQYLLISEDINFELNGSDVIVRRKNPDKLPTKTIDTTEIKKRCQSLGIQIDWLNFDGFRKERNFIEHLFPQKNNDLLKQLLSDAFVLIDDFIRSNLKLDTKRCLGQSTWEVLLNEHQLWAKELKRCHDTIDRINCFSWVKAYLKNTTCPKCRSKLIVYQCNSDDLFDCEGKCSKCDTFINDIINLLNYAVTSDRYNHEDMQSGIDNLTYCPECHNLSFFKSHMACLSCQTEKTDSDLECKICGVQETDIDNIEDGICSYCLNRGSND